MEIEDTGTEEAVEVTPEITPEVTTEAPAEDFEPEIVLDTTDDEEGAAILDAVNQHLDELGPADKAETDDDVQPDQKDVQAEGETGEGEEVDAKPDVDAKAKSEEKPDEKPDVEPKDDVDAKPSDEFGELPEGTKAETQERFSTLKGKYDELHTERDTIAQERDAEIERSTAWADTIKATGTNPEQFGMIMDYATKVNSGKREDLIEAHAMMMAEAKVLGEALGIEAPGFDPLEAHPDLKAEYDAGDIRKERAHEIAAARAGKNLEAARETQEAAANDPERARKAALTQITQVGDKLREDPHYQAKEPELVRITKLIVANEPDSSKWAASIAAAYKDIPDPKPAPVTEIKPVVTAAHDSIRPSGTNSGQGSVSQKAGSAIEAVDQALASM